MQRGIAFTVGIAAEGAAAEGADVEGPACCISGGAGGNTCSGAGGNTCSGGAGGNSVGAGCSGGSFEG